MMEKTYKANFQGELKIGGAKIACGVIDNEEHTRVISERSMATAFGIRGGGAYWAKKKRLGVSAAILPEYLSANYLAPYIGDELREKLNNVYPYLAVNKALARGVEATVLPDICDVYIMAERAGAIPKEQENIAKMAYSLLKGFANIGITALIDEASGFQEVRDRLALQQILDKYLLKEYAAWAKHFPDEFYQELFRLRGWQWNGMSVKRPSVVGHDTNDIVYTRITPGLLTRLKELNPKNEKGRRKLKNTQFLTPETGLPELDKHLYAVIALMKSASTLDQFHRMLARSFPKLNQQIPLIVEQ
jgi:hypothetical protein